MQERLNGSGKMPAQPNSKSGHVQLLFMPLLFLIRLYMSIINSKGLLLLGKELIYTWTVKWHTTHYPCLGTGYPLV